MKQLKKRVLKAATPVTHTPEEQEKIKAIQAQGNGHRGQRSNTGKPLPAPAVLSVKDEEKDLSNYITTEVKSSNGKVYKVVIPHSYAKLIPKTWKWTPERYEIADQLAAGYPITEIAKAHSTERCVIYGWLQHPEFRDHVDGLVLESGWANQRERIAGLNRVTRLLFDKVVNNINKLPLTDKSVGPILTSLQTIAKQIGQEKGEFIEQSKIEQQTNLSGAVGVAKLDVEELMINKSAEERAALEAEFNKVGNDIIRSITGEKE